MNELPTPQGSWANSYARNQKLYNLQLAAGLGFAAFSLFVVRIHIFQVFSLR